jgi:hypothetical protein
VVCESIVKQPRLDVGRYRKVKQQYIMSVLWPCLLNEIPTPRYNITLKIHWGFEGSCRSWAEVFMFWGSSNIDNLRGHFIRMLCRGTLLEESARRSYSRFGRVFTVPNPDSNILTLCLFSHWKCHATWDKLSRLI